MSKPLVSIIIPAFNEEKYLPLCLASLKKQTFKNFEIIVVDNNSTDKTADIAKSFGAKVIKETVQGMTPARERGFKEAIAEIIARTDADTVVAPNWLKIIVKTFSANPKAIALLGSCTSSSKNIPDIFFTIFTKVWFVYLAKLLTGHIQLLGPNMALRKSALQNIQIHRNDKLVHEDIDLACHLAERGQIIYVPEMKVKLSLRKIQTNLFKGLYDYLIEYPNRYFRTVWIHHPYFRG